MRQIIAIARKEYRGFLKSPGYFIVGGIFFLVLSMAYMIFLSNFHRSLSRGNFNPMAGVEINIHDSVFLPLVWCSILLFMFIVPMLGSKLLAEERKLNTFELIMTSPVTSFQIILGKYIGAMSAIKLMVLITLIYPLSTLLFSIDLQWGKLFSAYVGLILLSGVFTAIALFCSSFTESVIWSAISGVIGNFFSLWVISWIGMFVQNAQAKEVIDYISLTKHIVLFNSGSFEISSLVFLISVICMFCFLSVQVLESSKGG